MHRCLVKVGAEPITQRQRGRGRPPVYKWTPFRARLGEFQPTEKRTSVRAKQQVRQVRRLDSISRMLVKHGDHQQPTVHQDWHAVCRAKGFLPDFSTWCGEALPTYPTLGIVQQLAEQVRTSIRTLEAENSKASRQRWSDALNKLWKTQGNKLAHKVTAKGSNPFHHGFTNTPGRVPQTPRAGVHDSCCQPTRDASIMNSPWPMESPLNGIARHPGPSFLSPKNTLSSSSERCGITARRMSRINSSNTGPNPGGKGTLMGGALSRCRIPDEWKIDGCHLLTPDTFADALKGTRNNSAAGADSWRIPEIQALGQVALGCWAQYFNHILIGAQPWPEAMCWARAVLPGKTAEPTSLFQITTAGSRRVTA